MNERIKALRKELNLTLEKFGEKIGLKKSALSLIESGRNSVTEQTFKMICSAYNVNPDWLRTGSGDMFKIVDEDDELLLLAEKLNLREINGEDVRFRKKLLLAIGNLPEDDLKELLRIGKNLYDEIYPEEEH